MTALQWQHPHTSTLKKGETRTLLQKNIQFVRVQAGGGISPWMSDEKNKNQTTTVLKLLLDRLFCALDFILHVWAPKLHTDTAYVLEYHFSSRGWQWVNEVVQLMAGAGPRITGIRDYAGIRESASIILFIFIYRNREIYPQKIDEKLLINGFDVLNGSTLNPRQFMH